MARCCFSHPPRLVVFIGSFCLTTKSSTCSRRSEDSPDHSLETPPSGVTPNSGNPDSASLPFGHSLTTHVGHWKKLADPGLDEPRDSLRGKHRGWFFTWPFQLICRSLPIEPARKGRGGSPESLFLPPPAPGMMGAQSLFCNLSLG